MPDLPCRTCRIWKGKVSKWAELAINEDHDDCAMLFQVVDPNELERGPIGQRQYYAMKIYKEPSAGNQELRDQEVALYTNQRACDDKPLLHDGLEGIPRIVDEVRHFLGPAVILTPLGPSLGVYFDYYGGFTRSTLLHIAVQVIDRLEILNSKGRGLVHCNITPLTLRGAYDAAEQNVIYLTDFSHASEWVPPADPPRMTACKSADNAALGFKTRPTQYSDEETVELRDLRYASAATHYHCQNAPIDDLESLGYVLAEFASGEQGLPWGHVERSEIREEKGRPIDNTIRNVRDPIFKSLLKYYLHEIRQAQVNQWSATPDYANLRTIFTTFLELSEQQIPSFEWTLPSPEGFDITPLEVMDEQKAPMESALVANL